MLCDRSLQNHFILFYFISLAQGKRKSHLRVLFLMNGSSSVIESREIVAIAGSEHSSFTRDPEFGGPATWQLVVRYNTLAYEELQLPTGDPCCFILPSSYYIKRLRRPNAPFHQVFPNATIVTKKLSILLTQNHTVCSGERLVDIPAS